jgi:hypothetical protein
VPLPLQPNKCSWYIGDQDRPLYWFILNTPTNIHYLHIAIGNPLSYGFADSQNAYYQKILGYEYRNIDETSRFGNFNLSYDINEKFNFTTRIGANSAWGNGKNWRAAQTYNSVYNLQLAQFRLCRDSNSRILSIRLMHLNWKLHFTFKLLGYNVNSISSRNR